MNETDCILALSKELRQLTWNRVYVLLQRLNLSVYTFKHNYLEIINAKSALDNPITSIRLISMQNRDVLEDYLQEINRLLHNFVTAATSLINHTRRCVGKLQNEEKIIKGYQFKIDQMFKDDPVSSFVQDLRNYFVHYEHADIGLTVSFSQENPKLTNSLTFTVEVLLMWEGWTIPSKKYLADAGETVDALNAIETYANKVNRFHKWFIQTVNSLFDQEKNEFLSKETELMHLQIKREVRGRYDLKEAGTNSGEIGAFHCIFKSSDYEKLDKYPTKSLPRAKAAIKILKGYLNLADELETDIINWYTETKLRLD